MIQVMKQKLKVYCYYEIMKFIIIIAKIIFFKYIKLLKDEAQDLIEPNKGDITENLINIKSIFLFL